MEPPAPAGPGVVNGSSSGTASISRGRRGCVDGREGRRGGVDGSGRTPVRQNGREGSRAQREVVLHCVRGIERNTHIVSGLALRPVGLGLKPGALGRGVPDRHNTPGDFLVGRRAGSAHLDCVEKQDLTCITVDTLIPDYHVLNVGSSALISRSQVEENSWRDLHPRRRGKAWPIVGNRAPVHVWNRRDLNPHLDLAIIG